jgi:hypothetical protein
MTDSKSSFTSNPKCLTNSRPKPISGSEPGQLATNHSDMQAAARWSPRLKRKTITLLCAIVVASTGRTTSGQLAEQPPTQDAALITENGTPIAGTTFANWVATALTKDGKPNAASAAFYFQQCYGGGVLYDLTKSLKNDKVPWAGGAAAAYNQQARGQATPAEAAASKARGFELSPQAISNTPVDFWAKALLPAINNKNTVVQQATSARINDLVGVNAKPPYAKLETGQTYYSPNGGA